MQAYNNIVRKCKFETERIDTVQVIPGQKLVLDPTIESQYLSVLFSLLIGPLMWLTFAASCL